MVRRMASLVARRRQQTAVEQTLRSVAAATLAFAVADRLSSESAPLTAPLTALLVVQVTFYATLTTAFRRVNAVVVGVLIAIGFSELVGLHWWSLGLIILASLTAGHLVRVSEFVPEVAISAMLVLGVTQVASAARFRVLDTVIGAVVGLLFNVLFAPPVWVGTAGESIEGLARRMRHLMLRISEELSGHTPVEHAVARLHEARRLDHEVADVDAALRRAEDSLRLNPRVREALLNRVVLRTGLDALEISVVVLRVIARTTADLARRRTGEPMFPGEVGAAVADLLGHVADALVSFAVLVTTQVSRSAQTAEARLSRELSAALASRGRAADLLLRQVLDHPREWQLHGALLTEVDRILDELDTEHRSRRLMEELDRVARERDERYPWLAAVRRRVPVGRSRRAA